MINDPQQIDFTGSYTDPSGPQAQDPSSALLSQITAALAPAATTPERSAVNSPGMVDVEAPGASKPTAPAGEPSTTPGATDGAGGSAPTVTPVAQPTPAAQPAPATTPAPPATPHIASTGVPGYDTTAMLARLAPLGIKSLDELRTMDETKLRKLSSDVVAFEARQSSMDRFFFRNPDGSYDFTKGPDGNPTGLDASGRFVPPGQAETPPTPEEVKARKDATPKKKPNVKAKSAAKTKSGGRTKVTSGTKRKTSSGGGAPRVTRKTSSKPKPKTRPSTKKAPVVRQAASGGVTAL